MLFNIKIRLFSIMVLLIFSVSCSRIKDRTQDLDSQTVSAVEQNSTGGSGKGLEGDLGGEILLFQDLYTDNTANRSLGGVNKDGVEATESIMAFVDVNDSNKMKFMVAEYTNARIRIFDSVPSDKTATPTVVVGQPDFVTGGANSGGLSASSFGNLNGGTVCPTGELVVADGTNNRVLIFNQVPKTNGVSADVVIGQVDFTSNSANQGGVVSADTLSNPTDIVCNSGKLIVSDALNHRILIFNSIPTSNNASADVVIGQPDFVTNSIVCSASRYDRGGKAIIRDGKLYVADLKHHRVLVYNSIPTTNGVNADVVIGQVDMNSCSQNRGGAVGQNTLARPRGLSINFDGTKLAIAEFVNHRVVFYDLPLSTGDSAIAVLGQDDFVSNSVASPPTAQSFSTPLDVLFQGNFIWVSDQQNHRLKAMSLPAM